jgi:hypothetical protein
MEHPLINDPGSLSDEELYSRISDLQKKLAWAQRHNAGLAHQIGMALETYNNTYRARQQELWQKSQASGNDFSDRIDIS